MTWQALAEYDVIMKIDDVRNELVVVIFIVQVRSHHCRILVDLLGLFYSIMPGFDDFF